MTPWPHRYAALYRDNRDWIFRQCDGWTRLEDIDKWCRIQAGQLKRVQVFDSNDRLLLDRTFHDIL